MDHESEPARALRELQQQQGSSTGKPRLQRCWLPRWQLSYVSCSAQCTGFLPVCHMPLLVSRHPLLLPPDVMQVR